LFIKNIYIAGFYSTGKSIVVKAFIHSKRKEEKNESIYFTIIQSVKISKATNKVILYFETGCGYIKYSACHL